MIVLNIALIAALYNCKFEIEERSVDLSVLYSPLPDYEYESEFGVIYANICGPVLKKCGGDFSNLASL